MDYVPTGSIVLAGVLDIILVCGLSAAFGWSIARTAGSSGFAGLLVGLLLPVLGPLGWLVVAVGRDRSLVALSRPQVRTPAGWAAILMLAVASSVLVLATFLSWSDVGGGYRGFSLATAASPSDTVVGAVATVGSALVLLALTGLLLLSTAWLRVAVLAGFVAGAWLLVTIDSLVVIRALDGVSANVSGVSAGNATVQAAAGGGLWGCLFAASLVLTASAVIMTCSGHRDAEPPVATTAIGTQVPEANTWGSTDAWGATPSAADGSWGSPASQWGIDSNRRGGNR